MRVTRTATWTPRVTLSAIANATLKNTGVYAFTGSLSGVVYQDGTKAFRVEGTELGATDNVATAALTKAGMGSSDNFPDVLTTPTVSPAVNYDLGVVRSFAGSTLNIGTISTLAKKSS